ncbi:MAG TPA: helix-turn-helix domain-containing protein [Anaeromyxobacteraceae bacterium]|nr:helix-turn-helix domain-containing protein [Anaeromyxobacteraceae bacterium]
MGRGRRCACGGELRGSTERLSIELVRSRVSASVTAPAWRCEGCGGVHVEAPVLRRCHLVVGCRFADAGVGTGEAVRHMRKALGLRATDLARLLDVTPETVSHWETGKCAPNRSAFVALAGMVQDALDDRTVTRDRLDNLARGAYPRTLVVRLR